MAGYRLYFLDKRGSILLRKDFKAADDHQALQIAHLAARFFSLTCSGFALWQGKRPVWEGCSSGVDTEGRPVPRFTPAPEIKLQAEEILQRSRWGIATSQHLLAKLAAEERSPNAS